MKGQLELFEQAKAPIYHFSLTAVWSECPNCKTQPSKIGDTKFISGGGYYIDKPSRCPYCNQLLNWDDEAIEKAAKYSKDYKDSLRNDGECSDYCFDNSVNCY